MPRVVFTNNIQRHVSSPSIEAVGATVAEVLSGLFAANSQLRGYVLDDQGALRKHMIIFVNGRQIQDRVHLSDSVPPDGEIYIMQALSGG